MIKSIKIRLLPTKEQELLMHKSYGIARFDYNWALAKWEEQYKQGNKFVKTINIIKLEKTIKLIYRKLANIRNNHIDQSTTGIVKLKPYRIVMEDLNVSGMMKNKHLSEKIAEQKFNEFIRQMNYKCKFNNIEFIQADRFYPSSKLCSCCGEKKEILKLKERIFTCENCGLILDRDKNASINLGKYKSA